MAKDSPLIGDAYELASRVYKTTAIFPDAEREGIGRQFRETALALAGHVTDGLTTDDPAERQEVLREAAIACVTIEIELRLAVDLGCLRQVNSEKSEEMRKDISELIDRVADGVARERRTVRR